MIARLLISPSIKTRVEEIEKMMRSIILAGSEGSRTDFRSHPDVLYIKAEEKLGIAEARKIKEHFSLKPYSAKGRIVIIEDAGGLTTEAQNAILKTVEEPPREAILILGANSDANLLPTILSRCQISNLKATSYDKLEYHSEHIQNLERLLNSSIEERFTFIEKLKDREGFLHAMVYYFRDILVQKITKDDAAVQRIVTKKEVKEFLKELLQAEQWAKQNVSIRAILEYLMLVIPKLESSR